MNERVTNKDITIPRRTTWKSFAFAWAGIARFLREERNAQFHLAATVLVVVMGVSYRVSRQEAIWLVFVVTLVWVTEMINTAIEKVMDFISLEKHPLIKYIKDIAAGAVLVAAFAALITGLIIFLPKLVSL